MPRPFFGGLIAALFWALSSLQAHGQTAVLSVRDFGAAGKRLQDARPAIQKAIDRCSAAGGGTVFFPAGEYTSGQIRLRSHVRLYVESGATLYASKSGESFEKDKAALLYGENLENITIEGRGTIDGQAEYEWRVNDFDDAYIRENMLLMKSMGKPLLRSFPKGFPAETVYPRLVLLIRCKDVRIAGLSFIRSRSWTINPYACERLVIDGVYIQSSLKEAVWADGIDPDGCRDVRIANSTIETGDDAIVFYSSTTWGPALPCENITITNCRLSSASSALKFCDGNSNCVRRVTVDNSVITGSNRGIAFMVFDGGYVSDVVLSNLTIECTRHDWFWWGDGDPLHFNIRRRSEVDGTPRKNEPPAGSIRNVLIRNVIARGKGSSLINGHPDSWLEHVSLENIKLWLSHDPESPLEKAADAIRIRWARNLTLKDVEVHWDGPESARWKSALRVQDVKGLEIEGFAGRQGKPGSGIPVMVLDQVRNATIRNSRAAEGTGVFVQVMGKDSRKIHLLGNDLVEAEAAYRLSAEVGSREVTLINNIRP